MEYHDVTPNYLCYDLYVKSLLGLVLFTNELFTSRVYIGTISKGIVFQCCPLVGVRFG